MSKFNVIMPVAGCIYFEGIEAADEDEAIAKAMEKAIDPEIVEDLQMYKEICSGNVCNVEYSEAEVTEA